MGGIKKSLTNLRYKFENWFNSENKHQKYFDGNRFFMNILYLTISIIATAIIYDNIYFFNQYDLWIIRLGSILLLSGVYFIFKYLYYILKQIKNKHSNISHGQKAIIAILLIILLLFIYKNPVATTKTIKETTNKVTLSHFNPFETSGEKIVSDDFISELDLRKFTSFLPQPWGFLLFWGLIVLIVLLLLRRFIFDGYFPDWIVWILVVVGVIMLFQFKIPYNTVSVADYNTYCDDSGNVRLKSNMFGLGGMSMSLSCVEYKSSQCRPLCEGQTPVCQCEANIIDQIFYQKGEWILGIFG